MKLIMYVCELSLKFLEIFDKSCQSFNWDVFQTLFYSASCLLENEILDLEICY